MKRRFYVTRVDSFCGKIRHYALVEIPGRAPIEVEISPAVFHALEDMQKEYWRLERRESRHTLHLSNIELLDGCSDIYFPSADNNTGSENVYLALSSVPETQRRRLLLHAIAGLNVHQISEMEGCSERAIRYSLTAARRNLKKHLEKSRNGDFLDA